jgi:hypothetical protein
MANARHTDPETSHKAARSLKAENISETQQAILYILRNVQMSDEQIRVWFEDGVKHGRWKPASESGLRSRRAELVERGLVKKAGIGETKFGRQTILWAKAV